MSLHLTKPALRSRVLCICSIPTLTRTFEWSAGLVNVLVAKAFGAASIAVTDMLDANLQLASQMGATATLQVDPATPPDQAAASLKAAFRGGEGPDIVIDCAGFESTMQVVLWTFNFGVAVGCAVASASVPDACPTTQPEATTTCPCVPLDAVS